MSWMAWTLPTALFFGAIALSLTTLTLYELWRPTQLTRGFLPMATTRGDRFFIGLLSSAFVHLAWIGWIGEGVLWASVCCLVWIAVLLRYG